MNYPFWVSIAILFVFACLAISQDMKHHKVKNYITFPLLLFSIIVFALYGDINLRIILLLLIVIALSYSFYFYSIWGAADAKMMIALSLMTLAFSNIPGFFIFIFVLCIIYALFVSSYVIVNTSVDDKKHVLFGVDYMEMFLTANLLLLLVYLIFKIFSLSRSFTLTLVVFFTIAILLDFAKRDLKLLVDGLGETYSAILNLVFFFLMLYIFRLEYIYAIILVLAIRIFMKLIMGLLGMVEHRNTARIFETPFSAFLFIAVFVALLI